MVTHSQVSHKSKGALALSLSRDNVCCLTNNRWWPFRDHPTVKVPLSFIPMGGTKCRTQNKYLKKKKRKGKPRHPLTHSESICSHGLKNRQTKGRGGGGGSGERDGALRSRSVGTDSLAALSTSLLVPPRMSNRRNAELVTSAANQ